MSLLLDPLTLPVLGVPRLVCWLARTIAGEASREFLDEGRVRGELLELQQQYDAGGMAEEVYDQKEKALLERLSAIREIKARNESRV